MLKKGFFLLYYFQKKNIKLLADKKVIILKGLKIFERENKKYEIYGHMGECEVNFLDHTNMSNVHLSSLDGDISPLKISQKCITFVENNLW